MQKGIGGQLMVFAEPVSSVDHAPAAYHISYGHSYVQHR